MSLLAKANVFVLVLILTYGAYVLVRPTVAEWIWAEPYKSAMYDCDHSMRDHFIAKTVVNTQPSPEAIKNLQSAELSLLSCHEYDKQRKRLIAWGLSPNDLSRIGLEALEEKEYELRQFVEIHEIRY